MQHITSPPIKSADTQKVVAFVTLNYVLMQKSTNWQCLENVSTSVLRAAIAEAAFILHTYFQIPHFIVQETFNIAPRTWAKYITQMQFKFDQYEWFFQKVEQYAYEITMIIAPPFLS